MKRRVVSIEPLVLYEVQISEVVVRFDGGVEIELSEVVSNGRASYLLFKDVLIAITNLTAGSEGAGSDFRLRVATSDSGVEAKSYPDPDLYPRDCNVHVAPSSTFGPNNNGPIIKSLLKNGKYDEALQLCRRIGYDKSDYYLLTNTQGFDTSIPFRFVLIPTEDLLMALSSSDPRIARRDTLLDLIQATQPIVFS
jgi:hypothetical protein